MIHKEQARKNKENTFNLSAQCLEKFSSAVQELVPRGWHRVNRQEGFTAWRREKRWEMVGLKADGGPAVISLTPVLWKARLYL